MADPVSVALHVRAWVEIIRRNGSDYNMPVALHVRAWVEILDTNMLPPMPGTSPSM